MLWQASPADGRAHWFTQRLVVGSDVTHEVNVEFVPHLVDSLKQYFDPTTASGYRDQGGRDPTTSTVDYNASVNLPVTGGLRSITSAGGQYYHWLRDSTETYGENFPASGLSAVSSAARTVAGEDLIENNTLGGYVQEQLAWNDRLFLTGAVRVDRNSAFGTKVRHQVYPKVSGSWVTGRPPAAEPGLRCGCAGRSANRASSPTTSRRCRPTPRPPARAIAAS